MKKYKIYFIICFINFGLCNSELIMKSLVLPGWGEYSLDNNKAKNYFIREAVIWFILFSSNSSANWYKNNYEAFAELHAGVNMSNKNYLFSVNLGHYDSLEEYNDTKERQRLPDDKYIGDSYKWEWDDTINRIKFDEMRIKSVYMKRYARFAVGGLILHRLVSIINVNYLFNENYHLTIGTNVDYQRSIINMNLGINF